MTDTVEQGADNFSDQEWLRRFALYELLTLSFAYPTKRLGDALASGEYARALLELVNLNGLVEKVAANLAAASKKRDPLIPMRAGYEGKTAAEIMQYINAEYMRLFIGTPEPLIAPQAVPEEREKATVDSSDKDISRFYEEQGFSLAEDTGELPSHISVELAFLTYLAGINAGIAGVEIKNASDSYERFRSEYFDRWAGQFAQEVMCSTQEPLYRMAAAVLAALVE
jgi:TorA maturation chaperone TorD